MKPAVITIAAILSISFLNEAAAHLPQDHPYQVALRDYLATLSLEDFGVALKPVTYQPAFLQHVDEVHRLWMLMDNQGRNINTYRGICVAARHFLLSSIERDGEVYMRVGRNEFLDPAHTAWWALWDYPGNPYHGNLAVKQRAFVAAAVDLMMQDRDHDTRTTNRRSDYLGKQLIWYAYPYLAIRDELPENARQAYETGLRRMVDKLETWGPTAIHGDMDTAALVGLTLTARALGDDDLRRRAEAYAERLFDAVWHDAGFIDHGQGLDATYCGISKYYLTWAALASGDASLADKVDSSSRLKAYMNLPEPDAQYFYGPSHFNTATGDDAANDQWSSYQRDMAAAMLSDEARYLVWTGRRRASWMNRTLLDEASMRRGIQSAVDSIRFVASEAAPPVWAHVHWGDTFISPAADYYIPGTYAALVELEVRDSPLTRPPMLRHGHFVENFSDFLIVSKLDDMGVILHSGRLSTWGDAVNRLSGFSGGALSGFWTAATGPVILGRTAGYQSQVPDGWHNWRLWPGHYISGLTAAGKPFSSARQRAPEASVSTTDNSAFVQVGGSLTGSYTAPDDALNGTVTYERRFTINTEGLTVHSRVDARSGDNTVTELWETLPVWLGNEAHMTLPPVAIELRLAADAAHAAHAGEAGDAGDRHGDQGDTAVQWHEATTTLRPGVSTIRIQRHDGTVYLHFTTPQAVKLSPAVWAADYQSKPRVRNILIDLLRRDGAPAPLPTTSVQYAITTSATAPAPVNQPPEVDAGADQIIVLPAAAPLAGRVSDDGLPDPPATVTTVWSSVSGPGSVTFTEAHSPATKAWFSRTGTHVLRLTANDGELNAYDEVTIVVRRSTPFHGEPVVLPGRIQAEDYDLGGPMAGYHDTTPSNAGGAYRDEGVDIFSSGGADSGHYVGTIEPGEWLRYTVEVAHSRYYALSLRVAVSGENRRLRLELDDEDLTGSILLPDTGGPGSWQTVTLPPVHLPAGERVLRVVFESSGLALDWIQAALSRPPVTAIEAAAAPGRPRRTALLPNYPNPFNCGTVIPFQLDRAGPVRLELFNLLGQRLDTLVDAHLSPGDYRVPWDGRDRTGRPLTTDTYLYRLRIGAYTETRPMLLLR